MSGVNVNIHTVRAALDEAVDGLENIGVLNTDGTFNSPTPAQDVKLALLAEYLAQKFGIVVPAKVDALIKALPLLMAFVG